MARISWRRNALGPLLDLPKRWRERVVAHTDLLRRFPELGVPLTGRHEGRRRLIIGPYIVVYEYDPENDVVAIVLVTRGGPLFR